MSAPPVLTDKQRQALKQLLESAESHGWDYFRRGGWAGEQLYPLIDDAPAVRLATEGDRG